MSLSISGLEMPIAWTTAQSQNNAFDISADQLNIITNREMSVRGGVVDWQSTLMSNASDPLAAQDLATKNYVDTNAGVIWSTFPAQQDVDYVSLFKNINLVDPTNPQDSATKNYVDTQGFATELDELSDVTIVTPLNLQFLQFNSTSGQWENATLVVPAGNAITQDNSSVTVIDSGVGRIESVIDSILKTTINSTEYNIAIPIIMNLQQIRNLGTPAVDTDASTKKYVDDQIATLPTDLDGLSDVTITSPVINQVLVNNGSGQFINQLLLKAQLPSEIAYEDEMNVFTLNNIFSEGLQIAVDKNLDMSGGQILDTKFQDFGAQGSDPSDPALDDVRMFLDSGVDFGSPDPLLNVLIDRGGIITKEPLVTDQTIFALRNFANGMFIDEIGTRLADSNPTVRVQLFNEAAVGDDFDAVLDSRIITIESPDVSVTVGNTIDLTVGTADTPVQHFVILENILGVPTLTSNTVGFPSTGNFITIGSFVFQDLTSVIADGAVAVNAPDYEIFDQDDRGHLAHINDRIIRQDSIYLSGITLTTTPLVGGGTAGNVTYTSTAGLSFELHEEDIESFDITTDYSFVVNEGTQAQQQITRVNDIGLDLIGLTMADGTTVITGSPAQTINVVVFTIHNDDEPNQTNYGINLPVDAYIGGGRVADAINDINGFAINTVPIQSRGIALLIAEIVIDITTATTFEVVAVKDLRGLVPGSVGGGGGQGGGGATQLNELTDVTINTPLVDQVLTNDGAGQWVNILGASLLNSNLWSNFQDYKAIADPGAATASEGRFFTEIIDANNTALFCYLQRDGSVQKVRVA